MKTQAKDPNDQQYFDYLAELRDSGATNMWGAVDFLIRAFPLSDKSAREILFRWMNSFKENTP